MDFVAKSFKFQPADRCIVIGEIGVNHNNNRDLLFQLIESGIEAGLDIIKFQRFNAALEISSHAALADYQTTGTQGKNQLEMAKALELPDEWLVQALKYCKEKGVGFLCTAFEHESVDFLVDKLGCKTVKVPSPEISNQPLLSYMGRKFDSLIISSGASTLAEVEQAVNWVRMDSSPDLALMHCTSQYPAPIDQANLNAIVTMRNHFDLPVGYSDHTEGIVAATVCAGLGGAMIEKHYTLDKSLSGPDHKASADIQELKTLVQAVHDASAARGDGIKKPMESEQETRPKIRKSLYCHSPGIKGGTVMTADMIEKHVVGVKRPYLPEALKPADFKDYVGKVLAKDKNYDEPLLKSDFQE